MQKINHALKEEIIILKNKGGINYKINSNDIKKINLDKNRENINNNFNNIQIQVNNSMSKSMSKSLDKNNKSNIN